MNELINEYLLVTQPHEDLITKIMAIKKIFAETYQCPQALYYKPQIALLKFTQYELAEQRFINILRNIATENPSFRVILDGFGSYPFHTIYIQTQTTNQLTALVKNLKAVQAFIKPDAQNKPHFITEPIITIANSLLPWQYEKGWLEYSNTPFSASFMVTDLLLLKRSKGTKGYKPAGRFPLLNQITKLEQSSLF